MATSDTAAAGLPARKLGDPALLKRRYAAEKRYQAIGLGAIILGLVFLVMLFASIISNGWSAFLQSSVRVPVYLDPAELAPSGKIDPDELRRADFEALARAALAKELGLAKLDRPARRDLAGMLSRGIDVQIREKVLADPTLLGKTVPMWLLAADNVDALLKGSIDRKAERKPISDRQIQWVDKLVAEGKLVKKFNTGLFTFGASSQPETSGVFVAIIGSFFMMLTVVALAVPLGVAAAAYLEEFAPKNLFTDTIEVNINNLAAVPSIVFGLLGLAVFINFFGMPRSASLVGGLVLSLMTLPTIIIATRAAIRAVPPSIREAALGVGASKMQTLFHHTLPLALPGIMTGTIIGLVQALGETAPLLMIGMVAFVVDAPSTPLEPATALPVQIYMWATSAERGFVERTAGATIILLVFLFIMNAAAVVLRRRFERKW